MAAASLFLPFLPLLAKQILLNNLLSDLPGYRFGDFINVGVALQAIILMVTVFLVPVLFPF